MRKLSYLNNIELFQVGYFKYVFNMDKVKIITLSLWRQDAIQLVIASSQCCQRSCHRIGICNTFIPLSLSSFLFLSPPSTFPSPCSVSLVETFSQKYDLYRLDKGPLEKSTLNVEDATYALKTMNYIRRMENRAAELYRQRLINGFLHLYVGQVVEKNLDSEPIIVTQRNSEWKMKMRYLRYVLGSCSCRSENGSG